MDNKKLFKFMEELRQQSRFGQLAFQQLRTSLNVLDSERIFLHALSFLNHARHVSRLLWPGRDASRARGEQLRGELKLEDNSPLRLREIGPQLEREDERYEDWLEALGDPGYVDMNVMSVAAVSEVQPDVFQHSLDPDTLKMELRGAACDLKAVHQELRSLENAVQSWLRTHKAW